MPPLLLGRLRLVRRVETPNNCLKSTAYTDYTWKTCSLTGYYGYGEHIRTNSTLHLCGKFHGC